MMRRMRCLVSAVPILALFGVSPAAMYGQDASVNGVIERLRQGEPAIGTFTRAPGPGLDFAVIDTQYGEFDIDAVRQAVADLRGGPDVPAVTLCAATIKCGDAEPVFPCATSVIDVQLEPLSALNSALRSVFSTAVQEPLV